ncbi:hypothetical protein [Pararhodobacter oceanensis]|uniref:hypothetical protein n=1 Tax=Pararhodobacter oceanensis TaxID=2172121 RepID=UPI001057F64F|nr:hypothetical protein [Pararhodobacter oceanensis]
MSKYLQLRQLCWNRPDNEVVDGESALALYERNCRLVDQDAITPEEQGLLHCFVAEHGKVILPQIPSSVSRKSAGAFTINVFVYRTV